MTDFDAIWAAQGVMEELFEGNVSGISCHLVGVFSSGGLDEKVICKKANSVISK